MSEEELEQQTKDSYKQCLFCNEYVSIQEKQLYCNICGCPIINRCSNASCNTHLADDDCFCHVCGEESIFLKDALIPNEYNYRLGKRPINPHIGWNCNNVQYDD